MREMRRNLQLFFALTAVFLVCAVILPLTAKAASKYGDGVISLESSGDDVYKKADVTGDGKKDTARTTVSRSGDTRIMKLYVNGTKVKTWESKIKTATGKEGWLKLSENGQALVKKTAIQLWG